MRRLLAALAFGCLAALLPASAADDYAYGADSLPQSGVPKGKVTQFRVEQEQGLRRHGPRLLGLRAGAVRRQDAGLRDGLPGRRQLRQREGPVPRADRVRQPDPQEGNAGDDRHLHQPRRRSPQQQGRAASRGSEPQLRVRHALATSTPVPGEGDPARGRQDGTSCARTPPAGPSAASARAASVPSPSPGSGPTCSQGAQPRRQLHQHPRRRRLSGHDPQDASASRSASSCRTAPTTSTTSTATGRWPTSRWPRR